MSGSTHTVCTECYGVDGNHTSTCKHMGQSVASHSSYPPPTTTIQAWLDNGEVGVNVTREVFKEQIFSIIADTIGYLGTCPRKAVGALLVRDGRCISWGYNGAPPGQPHCEENFHGYLKPGWKPATFMHSAAEEKLHLEGCHNATHAEANALAYAARQGISTDGATLYVSVSPCAVCARLLLAAGIVRVVYNEEYRDRSGVELLLQGGVAID
jgi:dCMP deaminase